MLIWLLPLVFTATKADLDPECYMTVPEIAKHFGYKSEVHIVRTADEYLLELHRIPARNTNEKRPTAVFMQHGLLADGFNYAPNLPSQSAAFVFADAGFDVWVSNSRGAPASQKHIGYGPDDTRFWNFTWQEMSQHDLTASVDYILDLNGQEGLYYIGHSQGTVIMFAKLAEDLEFGKKILQFHALAPVATVSHIGGLFRLFGTRILDFAQFLLHRVPYTPLKMPKIIQKLVSYFCSLPIAQGVCTLDIGFIDGSERGYNQSRVGVYMCHMPAATSTKDLLHWIQMVQQRKFQKFDYGEQGNQVEYGQSTPPVYNLSRINTPTYLYWSKDDVLADTQDIRETIWSSMNHTIVANHELLHYTHIDFVFGLNATKEVYEPIIAEIRKSEEMRKKQRWHRIHRNF